MFWARAWQAWCTTTPPATGFSPGTRPWALDSSTTYSEMSRVATESRFTPSFSGRISGHSNFIISPQLAVRATTS